MRLIGEVGGAVGDELDGLAQAGGLAAAAVDARIVVDQREIRGVDRVDEPDPQVADAAAALSIRTR